jgi:type IV pilus assembly protein PilM
MPRKNDSWGIEVGANALKALRLGRSGSRVEVLDFEILPFKHILTTPDLNVQEAIQVNLDAFMAKHDLSKTTVVVSVPGHMAFARFAKLPPVEPKKIPDIVRFEAVQQIPFPIDQVEWDYQVFQQTDSPDVEVGIFAITKERVATFLSHYRGVGMRVDALTLSPLAVYNAFSYDSAEELQGDGTIYMDIGTTSTDVIIVEHGGIWLRTLPIGGNNFTDALVRSFKLSYSKAEKLKREASTSKYARQIFSAMRPVFADLVQEIQRSLGYYQSLNRDAHLTRLVGVGSTFRLPGLQKFLKQQLQVEVIRPDGFKRLTVEGKREADFADHALNMATAYGLALQGLGLETVSANILPAQIIRQRLWRSKQPWIGAAAACIAVAAGLTGARYYTENAAFNAGVEEVDRKVKPVVARANGYVNQMGEISSGTDPRLQIENLRRVLDYRQLWPNLLEDLSLASAAVNPQAATLEPDYAALAAIPRSQRQRLYIDEVKVDYLVGPGEADRGRMAPSSTASAEKLSGSFTADDFWPAGSQSGAGSEQVEDEGQEADGSGMSSAGGASASTEAPRFVVTVSGTTPHAEAARLLSQHYIKWLQEHAKRADRPYRIVVDLEKAIMSLGRATTEAPGRSRPGAAAVARPRTAVTNRPTGPLPPGFEDRFGGGMDPAMIGRGGFTGGRVEGLKELLPERPLSEEDRSRDWRFEVRWTVELLRPEEARRAESSEGSQEPLPAPEVDEPEAEQAEEVSL